jgi:hypothetical protein
MPIAERYKTQPVDGIHLISLERGIQLDKFTYADDGKYPKGELAVAASCYAYAAAYQARFGDEGMFEVDPPKEWPLATSAWKVGKTARITLAKAGALIAAEIDRLMLLELSAVEVQPCASARPSTWRSK